MSLLMVYNNQSGGGAGLWRYNETGEVQFAASSLLTNIRVFGWWGPVAWRMIRTKGTAWPVSGAVFSRCGPVYGIEYAD